PAPGEEGGIEVQSDPYERRIANEKTVMFQRSTETQSLPGKRKLSPMDMIKGAVVAVALAMAGSELLFEEEPATGPAKVAIIRPKLPTYIEGISDPQKSQKFYADAMCHYVADTVPGYVKAA